MSRSYRKNVWVVDGQKKNRSRSNRKKEEKRFANKAVRNTKDVPNGGAFKKFSCSWNIADYRWPMGKPIQDKIIYCGYGSSIIQTLKEQWEDYNKVRRK